MAHIPAGATFDMTFAVAYDRYKGVPAFSHAQLSIVGYSNKWLWEEAALGSGGENFCMDPYGSHTRAVVTDVRPRHFDGSWKQNIGGADFLQFWDSAGVYQMKKELDARLLSNGPDLSNATYTSISTDGAIKSEVQISGSRTDDLVRIFMRVRHEALSATDFSRLAYYSMGSETYNYYALTMSHLRLGQVQISLDTYQRLVGRLVTRVRVDLPINCTTQQGPFAKTWKEVGRGG